MAKSSFTRSNVNESTLQVSQPSRSSFDLGSTVNGGFPLGKFIPVRCEHLLPSAVLLGNITPEQTLKEIGVPEIGPLRLDTHTIAVSKRRINKDWVKVVKGSAQQQPFFNTLEVFGQLFRYLFLPVTQSFSDDVSIASVLSGIVADFDVPADATNAKVVAQVYRRAAERYIALLNNGGTDISSYNLDWYLQEFSRLSAIGQRYDDYPSVLPVKEFSPIDAVYEVMKPYFGEGSIMDRLGYPIFAKFGRAMSMVRHRLDDDSFKSDSFVWNDTKINLAFPESLTSDSLVSLSFAPRPGTGQFTYADKTFYNCSEWDVRASFAAWFDSLRNWHIEEASKLPNPDDWATQSIFALLSGVLNANTFGQWCCFLIPRYRNYQNDLFTTIQTDDVFRHIFSPIFNNEVYTSRSNGAPDSYDDISGLVDTVGSALNVVFPFGFFNRAAYSDSGSNPSYSADLQTMRRAGWLEKYCARNYYFPDTFEGKMQARYGISASDLLGVTSKYIEGGESFVTGQQTINATETAEMPAGSRTFQGGSAINGDTFTFAAGGDDVILVTFCSWMPLVTYSATNPHLSELSAADIVAPEFATDTRVQIQAMNLVRDLEHQGDFIGYVPRYINYRARLNEAHDEYLTDKRSFVWLRDWYSAQNINNGIIRDVSLGVFSQFAINAYDMRVKLPLDGFLNLQPWDSISYGKVTFAYSIDLPLPAAVEFI